MPEYIPFEFPLVSLLCFQCKKKVFKNFIMDYDFPN